jgi:NAD-dependent dihydropyrimidine dehydrogenase PreA subunit
MRLGYCQYHCNQCGPVCPSGAIPRFSLEQKHRTAIGLAYVDQSRCIPWRGWQRRDEAGVDWDRHNCGVCEEVCPAPGKAIHFRRERMPNGQELRLPYVRSESCVGCGFCEYSCPVQGQAAVRVTGGYREIEPAAPAPERTLVEQALPQEVGSLRLDGPKKLYEGAKGLIEYIDGGAEPYLKFHFVRVATAGYAAGAARVQADLWEFESSDDAFGAYSKDRSFVPEAQAVDVGDEGALADGPSVWARRGRYTITIVTMGGGARGEQAVELARVALGALDARPAPRPRVCRRLPQAGLEPHSVLFMRHPIHLQAVVMSDELAAVLKLDGSAVAAYGAYGTGAEGRRAGLLVVEYADGAGALGALARYEELQVGRARTGQDGVTVFEFGPAHFSAAGAREGWFALSLFVPDGRRAAELVREALGAG